MRTSGSTGTPLTLAIGKLVAASNRAIAERIYAWHRMDIAATMANMLGPESGRVTRGWSCRSVPEPSSNPPRSSILPVRPDAAGSPELCA